MFADETNEYVGYVNRMVVGKEELTTSWAVPLLPYLIPDAATRLTQQANEPANELSSIFDPQKKENLSEIEKLAELRATLLDAAQLTPISLLQCPEITEPRESSLRNCIVLNVGMPDVESKEGPSDWTANGVFMNLIKGDSRIDSSGPSYIDQKDGLTETIMFGENVDAGDWNSTDELELGAVWLDFKDGKADREKLAAINQGIGEMSGAESESVDRSLVFQARFSSFHPGGANVTYCDGSTRFLNQDVDYVAFARAMSSYDEGTKRAGTKQETDPIYRSVNIEHKDFKPIENEKKFHHHHHHGDGHTHPH